MLYREYLNNFFRGERCLGRAVFAARCSIIARYPTNDYLYGPAVLWTLFGDPALRVKHRIVSGVEESLTPPASSRTLSVSPNPSRDLVRISIPSRQQTADGRLVAVYDASGRLVYSRSVRASSFVLPTSVFPSGVYIVRCTSGAGSASTCFLVQHH